MVTDQPLLDSPWDLPTLAPLPDNDFPKWPIYVGVGVLAFFAIVISICHMCKKEDEQEPLIPHAVAAPNWGINNPDYQALPGTGVSVTHAPPPPSPLPARAAPGRHACSI